ncbi:MAG: hypothetical protein HYT81_09365, partial [Gemmatimonadetes bacterium]|nr:hypothetical protein [Gemmatimonadota bacterium]
LTTLRQPVAVRDADLAPGLHYAYYETDVATVGKLRDSAPVRQGVTHQVGLQGDERPEQFGLRFTGFIRIPRDGIYTFVLTSDDGSVLEIGGSVLVDHDGYHSAADKIGQIALSAGYHPFSLGYFQGAGGKTLGLLVGLQREVPAPLPAQWLIHRPE